MSLRAVVGFAGAAIGFVVGGPVGAQLGWALGSVAGNVIDPRVAKGPSLGDLAVQTSSEGGPIPITFGITPPIAGNIIATSNPKIVKTKSGGKKGKVESETVYRSYAVGICEGPIVGFLRIWRNNKLVFDGSEQGLVTPEENQEFLDGVEIYLGTYDQEPSPTLETIYGVGTTAAHRGIAYMVLIEEDLNDMQGACAQWQFQTGPGDPGTSFPVLLKNHEVSNSASYSSVSEPGPNVPSVNARFSLDFFSGRLSLATQTTQNADEFFQFITSVTSTIDSLAQTVIGPGESTERSVTVNKEWFNDEGVKLAAWQADQDSAYVLAKGHPFFQVKITQIGEPLVGSVDFDDYNDWHDWTATIQGGISTSTGPGLYVPQSKDAVVTISIRRKDNHRVLDTGTVTLHVDRARV